MKIETCIKESFSVIGKEGWSRIRESICMLAPLGE